MRRLLFLSLATLLTAGPGCVSNNTNTSTAARAAPVVGAPDANAVANTEYSGIYDYAVRLTDGRFEGEPLLAEHLLEESLQGQADLAVKHFGNAISLGPERPHYWYFRALAYRKLDRPTRARHDALIGAHLEWRDGSRDRIGWAFVRVQGDDRVGAYDDKVVVVGHKDKVVVVGHKDKVVAVVGHIVGHRRPGRGGRSS